MSVGNEREAKTTFPAKAAKCRSAGRATVKSAARVAGGPPRFTAKRFSGCNIYSYSSLCCECVVFLRQPESNNDVPEYDTLVQCSLWLSGH